MRVGGAECFRTIQTAVEAHPFSCTMDAETSPWVEQPERGAYHPASNFGWVKAMSPPPLHPYVSMSWSDVYCHMNTTNAV